MTGAAITIEDASAADTILSVKQCVFASNRELPVRRQRLMYRPGPYGISPLPDDETLGGAGVEHDGSAELDVLLVDLTGDELEALERKVWVCAEYWFSRETGCFFRLLKSVVVPVSQT